MSTFKNILEFLTYLILTIIAICGCIASIIFARSFIDSINKDLESQFLANNFYSGNVIEKTIHYYHPENNYTLVLQGESIDRQGNIVENAIIKYPVDEFTFYDTRVGETFDIIIYLEENKK